jgi:excisionase family DNA binding protein
MEKQGVVRKHRTNSLLTVREVAEFLNIHVNTVRRWSDLGILRSYRIGPRSDRRFRREDVVGFLPPEDRVED